MGTGTTPPLAETQLARHGDLDGYIERAPTPIYVWQRSDEEFCLTAVNRAAREFSGERADSLLGVTPLAFGDAAPDLAGDLRRCLDEQLEITREFTEHTFGDGTARNIVITCVAIPPDRVLVHAHDLTGQRAAEARLRASEERYRTLIQAANEGVWVVDDAGATVFTNQRVTRLLGHPADDILAGNIAAFVDPIDRGRVVAAVAEPRVVAHPFVATFRHRNGRALTFLVSVAPVGELGERPATLCVLADMTALKREQDLRLEAERRYRRIVETANEGVWTVDPTGVTTLVNQRMAEMLGLTPEEMEGHPFWDFAGDPTAIAVVQRALALDGRPIRGEVSLVRKDGSRLDVLISLSALRDERGALLGGMALVSDISAIKRGHEDLRESQKRFAQVFEEAPVGIAFIAAGHLRRGRFLEINAEFRRLLGYADDDLRKLDNWSVTHPDDREHEQELMNQLFERRRDTYELDKRYVRSDESVVWAHVRVALVRDDHGTPLYLIAVAVDISGAKHAEALAERAARTTGAILEHSSDAVVQVRADGVVTEFSPSAVRMFGYERDEAIGRDLAQLVMPAALRGRYREAVVRYLASGATEVLGQRYQTTAMRADGSEFPVEVTIDV